MARAYSRRSLAAFTALLCGCTSAPRTIRTYAGPELPPDKIAVLELRAPEESGDGSCDDRHFRVEVDGKRYEQCHDNLELAPGQHSIRAIPLLFELEVMNPMVTGPMRTRAGYALVPNHVATLALNAEPGRRYILVHDRITTTLAQELLIDVAIKRKDTSAPVAAGVMKWVP